jgi:hypothetical protein
MQLTCTNPGAFNLRVTTGCNCTVERKNFEAGFSLHRSRVEPRRFQAMGQLTSTCAYPHPDDEHRRESYRGRCSASAGVGGEVYAHGVWLHGPYWLSSVRVFDHTPF